MDKTNARYNLVFGRWFKSNSRNQVANYALAIIASQFLRYRSFAPFPQNNPTNLTICGDPRISRFSGDSTTPQKSHDFRGTPLHPKNLTIFRGPHYTPKISRFSGTPLIADNKSAFCCK